MIEQGVLDKEARGRWIVVDFLERDSLYFALGCVLAKVVTRNGADVNDDVDASS